MSEVAWPSPSSLESEPSQICLRFINMATKCDLSKIVKFGKYTMTCEMMIRDPIGHVQVRLLFKCVFDSKNMAPPQWIVCRTDWLKRWPNIFV
jgi:hypothetical protein